MLLFVPKWNLVLLFQLFSYICALPTAFNHHTRTEAAAVDILPKPVARRYYDNTTASITASMLLPAALYWHVTALVNGQEMALMVDTGSLDL